MASIETGVTVPAISRELFATLLLTIPLGVVVDATGGLVWGRNQVRQWSAVFGFLGPAITLVGIVVLLLAHRVSVANALAFWFVGQLGVAGAGILLMRPGSSSWAYGGHPSLPSEMVWFWRSGQHRPPFVGTLNFRLDSIFVVSMLKPRAVGLYSVAVLISQSLFLLSTALGASLLPVFSSAPSARVVEMANRSLRVMLLISILGAGVLALASRTALPFSAHSIAMRPALCSYFARRGALFADAHNDRVLGQLHAKTPSKPVLGRVVRWARRCRPARAHSSIWPA